MIKAELKRILQAVVLISILLYGIMYYIVSDVDVNQYNFVKCVECVFNYRLFIGVYSLIFLFVICMYLKRAVVVEKIIKLSDIDDYIWFLEKKLMMISAGYSAIITILWGEISINLFGLGKIDSLMLFKMFITQFVGWLLLSSLSLLVMFIFVKPVITFAILEALTILLNFRFDLSKSGKLDYFQVREYMYGFMNQGLYINLAKTFFYFGCIVVIYVVTVKIAQKRDFLAGKARVNNE